MKTFVAYLFWQAANWTAVTAHFARIHPAFAYCALLVGAPALLIAAVFLAVSFVMFPISWALGWL